MQLSSSGGERRNRALRVVRRGLGRGWRPRGAAGRRAVKEAANVQAASVCSEAEAARTKQRSSCTAFCDGFVRGSDTRRVEMER